MNTSSKLVILFSITFFLGSACTNQSPEDLPDHIQSLENVTVHASGSEPASSISLTETISIGDSEDVLFSRISNIDVDDSGNVYISEGSSGNEAIFVFDSNGDPITEIGRSGEGPGEFRSILDMKVYGDHLFVLDASLSRIQIFDIENHSVIHEMNLDPGQWNQTSEQSVLFPNDIFVLDERTILLAINHITWELDTKSYYQLHLDEEVISTRILSHDYIRQLPDPKSRHVFFDPFGGRGLVDLSTEKKIYNVWSDELLFKVYNMDGTYLRAFYHPFRRSTLSRSEALNFHNSEQFKSAIQHDGIPTHWRALEHMFIDDENRLWISTIRDNREIYEWWILDKHGNVIAEKNLPRSIEVKKVKDDFLYAVKVEEETGLQQILKYHIQWGG